MSWYQLNVVLHLLAMSIWFAHLFFWTLVIGPVTNRMMPRETGQTLRPLSLRLGGLCWPALGVLILTGAIMLSSRGVTCLRSSLENFSPILLGGCWE